MYLLSYFRPNLFVNKIENINLNIFKNSNLKIVLCDLDNTLAPHFTIFPTKTAIDFCKNIQDLGLKFIIVSNNSKKRVKLFAERLGVDDYLAKAHKPFIWKIKKFLAKYNVSPEEMIFIGDQFIFDILTANRLQCRSILTLPIISNANEQQNSFFKFLENSIYKKLEFNNIFEKKNIEMEEEDEIL